MVNYVRWLRVHAERRLDETKDELGAIGDAFVSTSEIDNLRGAADEIERLTTQLGSAQEKIEWLRGQVDYHVNDKCRMNMEKTASYVELQSRLAECQNALQSAQTDRLGADEYTKDLETRLETALKWIEAVRSCDGDRWECNVCGHSEPWWTHSNADELTKDIAVERQRPKHPEDDCDACGASNITWSAPSKIWNAVMGGPDGIVCPQCFDRRAAAHGYIGLWRFEAVERVSEKHMFYTQKDPSKCPHFARDMGGNCMDCGLLSQYVGSVSDSQ